MAEIKLKRGSELKTKSGMPEEFLLEGSGDSDADTAAFSFKPIGGGGVILGAVGGRRGRPARLIISGTLTRRDP
jgi:hypothetical protein